MLKYIFLKYSISVKFKILFLVHFAFFWCLKCTTAKYSEIKNLGKVCGYDIGCSDEIFVWAMYLSDYCSCWAVIRTTQINDCWGSTAAWLSSGSLRSKRSHQNKACQTVGQSCTLFRILSWFEQPKGGFPAVWCGTRTMGWLSGGAAAAGSGWAPTGGRGAIALCIPCFG